MRRQEEVRSKEREVARLTAEARQLKGQLPSLGEAKAQVRSSFS